MSFKNQIRSKPLKCALDKWLALCKQKQKIELPWHFIIFLLSHVEVEMYCKRPLSFFWSLLGLWGWEWYPHFLAGSFLYLVLQPSEAWCKVLFSSGLCWLLDSLGILVTKLYLMRKYEKIRWIYSLKYFSYMSCSRVKLGDFSSISTVLFSMVLISVWAAGIYYLGNELSQPWL